MKKEEDEEDEEDEELECDLPRHIVSASVERSACARTATPPIYSVHCFDSSSVSSSSGRLVLEEACSV